MGNERKIPKDFIEDLFQMDKKKATKLIVYGIFIAIIFGALLITSVSIADNSSNWYNLMNGFNLMNYHSGQIGLNEYLEVQAEYNLIANFMAFQDSIFGNVARIGVNIGVLCVAIGFLGYALNKELDDRTRLVSLILGGVIMFVMLMAMLGTFSVEIT
ncbi:MAG: hypothetical protein ACFFCS_14140 [Candidatus Hodarchaeota archaeon]